MIELKIRSRHGGVGFASEVKEPELEDQILGVGDSPSLKISAKGYARNRSTFGGEEALQHAHSCLPVLEFVRWSPVWYFAELLISTGCTQWIGHGWVD